MMKIMHTPVEHTWQGLNPSGKWVEYDSQEISSQECNMECLAGCTAIKILVFKRESNIKISGIFTMSFSTVTINQNTDETNRP
jgi:hypothetical protein